MQTNLIIRMYHQVNCYQVEIVQAQTNKVVQVEQML